MADDAVEAHDLQPAPGEAAGEAAGAGAEVEQTLSGGDHPVPPQPVEQGLGKAGAMKGVVVRGPTEVDRQRGYSAAAAAGRQFLTPISAIAAPTACTTSRITVSSNAPMQPIRKVGNGVKEPRNMTKPRRHSASKRRSRS